MFFGSTTITLEMLRARINLALPSGSGYGLDAIFRCCLVKVANPISYFSRMQGRISYKCFVAGIRMETGTIVVVAPPPRPRR